MHKVHTIDLNFQGTQKAVATFLVENDGGLILIESGPYSCYQTLTSEIGLKGFNIEDVKHVLLTHIHFDHAGAAWKLAENGAKIYVHPFGARHLINPEKLLASAKMIYKDQMDTLWGEIKPINDNLVVPVDHEQEVIISDLTFKSYHTPGHARHHICWKLDDMLFAGDVAGVKIDQGPIMPPCPPPDIDIEAWKSSLGLIKDLVVRSLFLTHFGPVNNQIDKHLSDLETELSVWSQWIEKAYKQGESQENVLQKFVSFVRIRLENSGLDQQQIKEYELANPSFMSVAGLYRYWNRRDK